MKILTQINAQLAPFDAQLVAVSKTKPNAAILELYADGQRVFGENYVQELVEKQAVLPSDIAWHFIGHLQSNKVKYIAPFVTLIHAVDSVGLVKEIDKQGKKNGRVIDILLQFHIAEETSKFGLLPSLENTDLQAILTILPSLAHVCVRGVMGMGTFTDDKNLVRNEFKTLKKVFDILKNTNFAEDSTFSEISMGMSDDYLVALEEGSTLVRIGSLLFGKRGI